MLKRKLLNMRLKFILITLSFLSVLYPISAETEIELRVKDFCNSLRGQNIAHYSTRDELKIFFKNNEELSDYIVMLYYIMNENKFKNFLVLDCNVTQVNQLSDTIAEVEYKLTGNRWLFLHKSIKITDRWERENGNWFLIPHEILKRKD